MILASDPFFRGRLLAPAAEAYEALTDKARLIQAAQSMGIATPETFVVDTFDALRDAIDLVCFPLVIKPSRSRLLKDGRILSTGVKVVATRAEARCLLESAEWFPTIPALLQHFVPGTGAGAFALFWEGQPICWFAHRRLRERPPQGGVSVLSESASVDPILQEAAQRLLGSVRWSGLAMVEFRISGDGTPYLMEVNGRPWGSLQLPIDCGIDFPWLQYCAASGTAYSAPIDYEIGRRLHWTLGDLDRLIMLLGGSQSIGKPPSRPADVADFLWTTVKYLHRSEVLRLSDPSPGFYEIRHWIADVFRSRRHRAGPGRDDS